MTVGKSIDELSLGGNDGDDGGDDGHSCDSPVDEVVFCLQQGFPNSILVLVILKSDLALPHVWLEKVVFGEKRCSNQTPTFFQTKVSEWIFSLTQRFLQLA